MQCGTIGCPHKQNRFVDVVAMKGNHIYAFEYKSATDYILRAVEQVENYRQSFDFVVVVAEIPRFDISLNPTRGIRIKEFIQLGVGIWAVEFKGKIIDSETHLTFKTNPHFTIICEPKLQTPIPRNREWVIAKFKRYGLNLPFLKKPPDEHQQSIIQYL
jgi:hypothetical protein